MCRLCRARHDDCDKTPSSSAAAARVAFITNEGFANLLLIGRQKPAEPLRHPQERDPQPLVPREDCHTVTRPNRPGGA